jgi:hypothetical protein
VKFPDAKLRYVVADTVDISNVPPLVSVAHVVLLVVKFKLLPEL